MHFLGFLINFENFRRRLMRRRFKSCFVHLGEREWLCHAYLQEYVKLLLPLKSTSIPQNVASLNTFIQNLHFPKANF